MQESGDESISTAGRVLWLIPHTANISTTTTIPPSSALQVVMKSTSVLRVVVLITYRKRSSAKKAMKRRRPLASLDSVMLTLLSLELRDSSNKAVSHYYSLTFVIAIEAII